jgi:glycosyltransferase involved in cell wall biosynthesis
MKILMIHPHDIYDDLEPWTVRITYLAQELVDAGHEITLVYHLRNPSGDLQAARVRQDHEYQTVPFTRIGPGLLRRCFEIEKLAVWSDIVHFQKCAHYAALPALFAAYLHRRPVHYDWDDWEQKIYDQSNYNRIGSWIFFQQMERHLLKLVDTISVSSYGLRQLTEQYHFPQDRVFYLPVGADLKVFSPSVDGSIMRQRHGWRGKLVIYHGQISGANYVNLYIRAAKTVLSRRSDIAFVVVGGGDHLDEAKDLANQLRLGKRLTFTGEVPHNEIPYYIAAADVAVACFEDNPQSRCKSPLKLAEYMASGKAIVASRIPEVLNMIGNSGLLVDPENPDDIAPAIEKIIDNEALREQLGRRVRKRSEQFYNWKRGAQTLIEAYKKALDYRYQITKPERRPAIPKRDVKEI